MKPGRELDALVAEKVMGCKQIGVTSHSEPVFEELDCRYNAAPYSSDITAAWDVVQHLDNRNINEATDGYLIQAEQGLSDVYFRFEFDGMKYEANAKTLPMAICLAALKAVGVEV